MIQREVSLCCVMAWVGWVLALVVSGVSLLFHMNGGGFAVVAAAAAGTLHVKGFVAGLEQREREAFRLGRDSVRLLK